MWRQIHWRQYLPYAIAAAIVYCIPAGLYLNYADYTKSWLLYLGNLLFLFPIMLFLFSFNRKRSRDASTVTMLTAGHITTAMGIVIACLLCVVLSFVFTPDT